MKQFLIIILFFQYQIGFAQIDLSTFPMEETGRCFASFPLDTTNTERYYIQYIPATYEKTTIKLNDEYLLKHFGKTTFEDAKPILIETTPSGSNMIVIRKKDRYCLSEQEYEHGKFLCLVENIPRYEWVNKVAKIKDGDTTLVLAKKEIQGLKQVKEAETKIYKTKEEINPEYPAYEMIGGEWSPWSEKLCHYGSSVNIVFQIQDKLWKLGYEFEAKKGILNMATRDALIDFQRKNNLPTGRVDRDTLLKLGIISEDKY